MHSWISTQDEGWVRYAFERLGVPYTGISDQEIKAPGFLDRFDVVVFPHVGGNAATLLNGRSMAGPPVPWKKTAETPHLGSVDETDDVRPGMGLDGLLALRRFVERGGLLVTEGATSRFVADMGFHSQVSGVDTPNLRATRWRVPWRGRHDVASRCCMDTKAAVSRSSSRRRRCLAVGAGGGGGGGGGGGAAVPASGPLMGIGGKPVDPAITAENERTRARVIVRWAQNPDSVLISGLIAAGGEMAGRAAVIDAPVGSGHVIFMGTRPWYRWQNQGSMALAFNAIANWNALSRPVTTAARPGTRGSR